MILMTGILSLLLAVSPMTASFYGEAFHGNPTASGEIYDMNAMTAAHVEMEFGTRLLLTRGSNAVIVEVTDRGPYCFEALREGYLEPHPTRQLDLSKAAFQRLTPLEKGIIDVNVTVLPNKVYPLPDWRR